MRTTRSCKQASWPQLPSSGAQESRQHDGGLAFTFQLNTGGYSCRHLCLPSCRFNVWAVVFVVTRLFTLTLYILVIGFGLPRVENQALDPERGNFFSFLFNNILFR